VPSARSPQLRECASLIAVQVAPDAHRGSAGQLLRRKTCRPLISKKCAPTSPENGASCLQTPPTPLTYTARG
jgi:hypothetical protein